MLLGWFEFNLIGLFAVFIFLVCFYLPRARPRKGPVKGPSHDLPHSYQHTGLLSVLQTQMIHFIPVSEATEAPPVHFSNVTFTIRINCHLQHAFDFLKGRKTNYFCSVTQKTEKELEMFDVKIIFDQFSHKQTICRFVSDIVGNTPTWHHQIRREPPDCEYLVDTLSFMSASAHVFSSFLLRQPDSCAGPAIRGNSLPR